MARPSPVVAVRDTVGTLHETVVAPGESWREAAERVAEALGAVSVLPVDLSADPPLFGVRGDDSFAARPMTRADVPHVVRWVVEPHVARWWAEHRSPEQVAAHYSRVLGGESADRLWVLEVNGRSVGFAQDYLISDHPEYALLTGAPDAVGVDYAIGVPAWASRGYGTPLLWTWLRDAVVPGHPESAQLHAAPDHRNAASRRVLAKLGFVEGWWFDEPRATGEVTTMVTCTLDVDQVLAGPPEEPDAA